MYGNFHGIPNDNNRHGGPNHSNKLSQKPIIHDWNVFSAKQIPMIVVVFGAGKVVSHLSDYLINIQPTKHEINIRNTTK